MVGGGHSITGGQTNSHSGQWMGRGGWVGDGVVVNGGVNKFPLQSVQTHSNT